jgi:hypothetical protein
MDTLVRVAPVCFVDAGDLHGLGYGSHPYFCAEGRNYLV